MKNGSYGGKTKKMNATLVSHCGTTKVDRQFLSNLELPERTDTFQPIAHAKLVDTIEEALSYRRISIVKSEFAVSKDGMKCFGLLEVNHELDDLRFAIGMRNANDKSMRLGMVAGYRVFVCDNMSLAGDFYPLQAKHTKNLDLVEAVSMGIDRIQRQWTPLREAIDHKKSLSIGDDVARLFIYRAFTDGKMPVSLFKSVHNDYFDKDGFTAWDLENSFTESFKSLNPVSQFQATAKLGRLLSTEFPTQPVIDIEASSFC